MDIIVPIKHFGLAKSRLAPIANLAQRGELARALAEHVLTQLRRVAGIARILVVSDEPEMVNIAARHGCCRLEERGSGLNAAVRRGLLDVPPEAPVGVVHADLPLLSARSMSRLIWAHQHRPFPTLTLVVDTVGTGSNILLCSASGLLTPQFGPDSAARHTAMAAEVGFSVRTVRLPKLSRDCDTAIDIARIMGRVEGNPRLQAVIAALAPARHPRPSDVHERPLR
ncbi:2-phospho-L-lactate guanylyltransferase [Xanthobacteraceae bacterium A53D]